MNELNTGELDKWELADELGAKWVDYRSDHIAFPDDASEKKFERFLSRFADKAAKREALEKATGMTGDVGSEA